MKSKKELWIQIIEAIRKSKVDLNDQEGMQREVRKLIVDFARTQSPETEISMKGTPKNQVLRKFDSPKEKREFLNKHAKDKVWGEDSLLLPFLQGLGYQPFMNLPGTALTCYMPFEQKEPLFTIELVNHGAEAEGTHWELKGRGNPGGGNCMYYTVAQQLQKDLPKVMEQLGYPKGYLDKKQTADVVNVKTDAQIKPAEVDTQKFNAQIKQAKAESNNYEKEKDERFQNAKELLNKCSVTELLDLYDHASPTSDYLKGRINAIKEESEDAGSYRAPLLEKALGNREILSGKEGIVKNDLVHMLAREMEINPKFKNYATNFVDEIISEQKSDIPHP